MTPRSVFAGAFFLAFSAVGAPALGQPPAQPLCEPWEAEYARINPAYFDQADLRLRWLVRSGLVPVVNFGSWLGPILFFIGLLMGYTKLAWVGVLFFAGAAVFAVITLPVEFNASRRALQMLTTNGLVVSSNEAKGAKQVLDAAALTYVAALAQALSTLLYYVFLLTGFSRRRD